MNDLDPLVRDAVRHFWLTRLRHASKQDVKRDRDRGSRSAVTGGKQMDGFVRIVRQLLLDAGAPETAIAIGRRIELPGWFRAEKQWDLTVVHSGQLLGAIEFKSQIGPSFGNNFNNRTEEAIGSATDIWSAFREGAFRPSARPVLGYLMLLEDCDKSRSPVKVAEPHFKVFPKFQGASYQSRYMILLEKLLRDRLYDSACLILSRADAGADGSYVQPHSELTFSRFVAPLLARVRSQSF